MRWFEPVAAAQLWRGIALRLHPATMALGISVLCGITVLIRRSRALVRHARLTVRGCGGKDAFSRRALPATLPALSTVKPFCLSYSAQ